MKSRFFKAVSVLLYTLIIFIVFGSFQSFAAADSIASPKVQIYGKNNGAYLKWTAVEGVTGYRIYQRLQGKWEKLTSVYETEYTVSGLKNSKQYIFCVKPYTKTEGKVVWGQKSNTVKVRAGLASPILKAKVKGESVDLSWSEVYSARGYRIYSYISGKWKELKTTLGTTYTIQNLSQGKEYRFAVRSYVKSGEQNVWSDYAEISVKIPVYKPADVTGVSVVTKGTYLQIKWNKSERAKGYKLYKSESGKSGTYKPLATVKGTSYNDKAVKKNKKYYYIIKAYSVYNGQSYYSPSSKKAEGSLGVVYKNSKKAVWAKNNVVIREKPKTGAKIMGTLGKGAGILQLSVSNNGWTKVRYTGNRTGYVSSRFLTANRPSDNPLVSYNATNDRLVVDPTTDNWKLVVVNSYREFSPSYKPKLTQVLSTGIYLDYRVTPYYEKMYLDAKKEGIILTPYSGYRSYERQKYLFDSRVANEMKNNKLSKQAAIKKVGTTTLPPGTSEHNLGLAMDITCTLNSFKNSKQFKWLEKNAHKYGFILRYPENSIKITGIIYEPWHWRFVGVEHAEKIKKSGLTLEQYLDKNKIPY